MIGFTEIAGFLMYILILWGSFETVLVNDFWIDEDSFFKNSILDEGGGVGLQSHPLRGGSRKTRSSTSSSATKKV